MNYPKYRADDKVLRVGRKGPWTVLSSRRVAGTYIYDIKSFGGRVEEAFETDLRRIG